MSNINQLIIEQEQFLKQIGFYDSPFTNRPGSFLKSLAIDLEKMAKEKPKEDFALLVNARLDCMNGPSIELDLIYGYYPSIPMLQLDVLWTKINETERVYFMSEYIKTPTAKEMYDSLINAEKLEKANKIANHRTDGKVNKL